MDGTGGGKGIWGSLSPSTNQHFPPGDPSHRIVRFLGGDDPDDRPVIEDTQSRGQSRPLPLPSGTEGVRWMKNECDEMIAVADARGH